MAEGRTKFEMGAKWLRGGPQVDVDCPVDNSDLLQYVQFTLCLKLVPENSDLLQYVQFILFLKLVPENSDVLQCIQFILCFKWVPHD